MNELILAALVFTASHVVFSSTPLRPALARVLGEWPYIGVYSIASIALLVWLVAAYGRAPEIVLWDAGNPTRHLSLSFMAVASLLLTAGYSLSSPTGMRIKPEAVPPAPTGIFKVTRHPVMWAVGLWAISHIAANGDLASLVFFGSMTVLALGGTLLIDRKVRRRMGADWTAWAAETSNVPFAALFAGRARVSLAEIGYLRLAAGIVLYAVFFLTHETVVGATPFHL